MKQLCSKKKNIMKNLKRINFMKMNFFKHNIDKKDIANVVKTLQSLFITTGPVTAEWETQLAHFFNVPYALGLNSCTAGLHLLLLGLGIGKGDEVIVPSLTFVSSVNVIEFVGAKPIFADVETDTGLIDVKDVEKKITKKTKAIIGVHLYGQMVDVLALSKIAKKHKLKFIEDSAHGVDCMRDGYRPGQFSDGAAFSFYATKNITSGEGGAIVTKHKALAEKIKVLRTHGMSKDSISRYHTSKFNQYDVKELGYKYNMTDIQASLLIGQLKRIDENTAKREKICQQWEKIIDQLENIDYPKVKYGKSSRHLFSIWVDPAKRDKAIQYLNKQGIPVSVHFKPVHTFTYYKKKYKKIKLKTTERIGKSTISLPLYPQLTKKEIDYISATLKKLNSFLKV